MTGFPFIESLFTSVLKNSKTIQGRFHLCKNGSDINSDQLGEGMLESIKTFSGRKYPLAMMLPPRSHGNYTNTNEWETFRATLYFLDTSYYSANQVKQTNPLTGTSTQKITEDWNKMKSCAIDFLRVLEKLQKDLDLCRQTFRLSSGVETRIHMEPVSFIGVDRASGIRCDFSFSLFIGCAIEDYNPVTMHIDSASFSL